MQAQHFLAKVCKFLPSYTVPHPGDNPSIYLKVSEHVFSETGKSFKILSQIRKEDSNVKALFN
jgi:hypothetical protein